jgi:thiol-disulfide isomerase/thioredoxin
MLVRLGGGTKRYMIVAVGFLLGAILFAQLAQPIHRMFDPLQVQQFVSFKQMSPEPLPETVPAKISELKITTIEGNDLSLRELASQNRLVVINFWATWCVPCLKEMPHFEKIHRDYQNKGVAVLGVAAQDSASEVKAFIADNKISYTIALDENNKWANAFGGLQVLPTTICLDGAVNVLKIQKGYLAERELERTLEDLLSR